MQMRQELIHDRGGAMTALIRKSLWIAGLFLAAIFTAYVSLQVLSGSDSAAASGPGEPKHPPAVASAPNPAVARQAIEDRAAGTAAQADSAPVLSLAAVPDKNHIVLTWTADPSNCSYEVHRHSSPYFAPGPSTLQATLPAGITAYTDYGAARNSDINHFYIVRAIGCGAGDIFDSNTAGEFDLLVGSQQDAWPAYRAYGLNFSPYIADGENPDRGGDQITDEELADRMALVAPYTRWVRTFGCNNDLREAGRYAHTMGLKAAVGAWLGSEATLAGQQENRRQIDCLKEQALAGHVDIAIVGSEVLLRGDLSESQLLTYINEVKQYFQTQGITVPVTYADVYSVLLLHPNVVSAVDLVFANYYPYWEGKKLDYAVAYVDLWHQQLISESGGKEVIVSETGWPSCGNQIGEAIPSPENASDYFLNFVSWARANEVKYFYFEAYDEGWKIQHEGPQGACWGVWDKHGALKPGMERVFDGATVPLPPPAPEAPIIHFQTLPDATQTNLPTFVVASFTEPGNQVLLNGVALPAESMDAAGNFAIAVPLAPGDNTLALTITSGGVTVAYSEKHVFFDAEIPTGNKRLLYVDSVAAAAGVPSLPGTIVIDLDQNTLLGIIENKHVVGISPDGGEIYMSDRAVISTDTHQQLRTFAFTQDIVGNGFLISPDGARLYSRNQRLDNQTNALLENLPVSIVTGSSWAGAPIPGGPAISPDGRRIYCCNSLQIIDTQDNTVVAPPISASFLSDIGLTPDESRILITSYSYGNGALSAYNAVTFEQTGSVGGLGDFVGEIRLSNDGQKAIIGSAGNPASVNNGRVTVVDLSTFGFISQKLMPLADNLAASANNEIFISTGENGLFRRQGIEVYMLDAVGNLERVKSFFLGINRFVAASGAPQNDQIRKIIFKP